MLRIRLQRKGKHKQPFYRIVVIEGRKKREGESIETIGFYNPLKESLFFNEERWNYWISRGAQPSDIVSVLHRRWCKERQLSSDEGENIKNDIMREISHNISTME
mgnify:CR=1 FL=1